MKTKILNITLIVIIFSATQLLAQQSSKALTTNTSKRINFEVSAFPNHDALSSVIGFFDFSIGFGGGCFLCWGSGSGSSTPPPYRIEGHNLKDLIQVGVNYQYFINKRVGFKYGFQYGQFRKNIYTDDIVWGKQAISYYTIHQDVVYRFYKRSTFEMYSLLGIAGTYKHTQNNLTSNNPEMPDIPNGISDEYNLNFQVTPFGFRVGEKIAFTAELGIGYKGGVNVGLSKQFN